jgi:hypothetical protein
MLHKINSIKSSMIYAEAKERETCVGFERLYEIR